MPTIDVMIVDSQPFFRAGVRQALAEEEQSGLLEIAECDPGENGTEAMARLAEHSPDVVLLDIHYPNLSGLELGRTIVRNQPGTRLVILSANPENDDDELFEVIKIGAVAYIRSRECTPGELIDTINRAYDGEYPINDSVNNRPKVAWHVLQEFQRMASLGRTLEEIAAPLTPKEIQILTHIADGNSNKRIANILGISEQTIKNQVSAILRKLNANDRAHAVFLAIRKGWISTQPAYQETQPS